MPVYKSAAPTEGGVVILKPGIYFAIVTEAKEGQSGNHNDKIDLTCELYRFNKEERKAHKTGAKAWDTLVFTEKAFWKIDQFRAATGETVDEGIDIEINAHHCKGRKGWVRVGNETIEQGKHAGKEKNTIEQWLFDYDPFAEPEPPKTAAAAGNVGVPSPAPDLSTAPDDIPF